MVRFRGRRLQAAACLDPPWLGLRRWSGRNPVCAMSPSGRSAQKAASFRRPPSSARSPAPPISSSLAPSPTSGAMLRPSPSTCVPTPSPSTCVPLPSPLERPALSRVGTARSFRAPPASRSSSGAAVILPAPGACSPLPSPPVSSAFGQVWTARRLRPPPPPSPWIGWTPYTGVTLAAPGACVPPSPQASLAQGVLLPPPSTCLLVPSSLERPARNPVGMAKHLLPPPALRSSKSAAFILPALGAGLRLPSPPRSSAICQLGTARCLRPPPPLPSPSKGWPPYTGITLAVAGSCVPPSLRASPLPGAMLPPATEDVDEELWYASKDKESVEQVMKKMRLTATDADMLVDYDETDQGKPPWRGASLSQLAYLQQPSPMEPPECLQLQYATSAEWSGDRESVEEMLRKMKLFAAAEAHMLVDDDEEDQGKQPWVCAGLSQLAYLQQPSPMEPAECLQLPRHRPVIGQRFDTNLLQFKSRLASPRLLSRRLFTRSFATESSSPPNDNKKNVEFSPLSPHLAPVSVKSHKIGAYRRLKEFEFSFMNPDHIRATLANDLKVIDDQFDVNYLMRLYDEKVEDILVANGIFVDPSDATYLAALDAGLLSAWEHVFEQKGPLYLTTLDVMCTNVALPPFKWRHFMDYLRDRKIIVIKRWDLSLGKVETMMYNHGFEYALGGRKLFKGQTDASFKKTLNRAALCGITWDDTQVFDCLICSEIACKSNIEAEMLSAIMLLRRAIDLKIEDYVLYTDCSHVNGVLKEEIKVKPNSEHEELSRLLVGLKARFRNIFCQLEPREKLMFPDCLLRLERAANLVFEEILRIWSPCLLGLPIFRIHQKRHKIVKDMIAKQAIGGKLVLHHAYKVKVKDDSRKLDGLRDVVKGMLPKRVEVLVRNKKEALVVKQELKKLFPVGTLVQFVKRKENLGQGYEVAVMKHSSGSTGDRILRVIFHSSMEDVTLQRMENTIIVKLLTPKDSDECIEELRPECFLFFNGKPGALLDIEKKS